jgi:hypothetical protein
LWTFSFTRWRELLVPSSRDDSPPCRNLFRSSLPAHSRVLLLLLTGAVEHISRRRQNNTVSNKSWGRRLSGHAVYIITTSIFLFTFFLFRFFLFFPFFCGLVLCQSLSLMATHQQLVKDLCYWKWGECFLCFLFSFFPAAIDTNVTMKLVKSFFGIVRHSIHNLFDSCIPIVPHPTRVTHLMLSAQSKWWNVLSTGWREFRKPFNWLAVHV